MQKFVTVICLMIALLLPIEVLAVSVEFSPEGLGIPQQKSFTTTIVLDTKGENLNAVEGTVLVAKELGSDLEISDSGSVVTFWVKRPVFDPVTRSISFSGTMPGGYTGSNGLVFSIILRSYNGSAVENALTVTGLQSFINDGLGTPAKVNGGKFSLGFEVDAAQQVITDQIYGEEKPDNAPPEVFDPQVGSDPDVFDGKWFIAFATTDKQSGVDRYELQESSTGQIDSGKWQVAQSPFLLTDQTLRSYIFITAIDRQGNERVIKVFPKHPQGFWQKYANDFIAASVIIIIVAATSIFIKRRFALSENQTPPVLK